MKPPPFTYVRAGSIDEALDALGEHGDEARVLAGGQSLMPMMNMRLSRPAALVDANGVAELGRVERVNGTVRVGAMVRQSALTESIDIARGIPMLRDCAPWIGHWVTRNRGTVGGSIAHADARAELPLALVALGGSVIAASRRGRREIGASELFAGHFTTSLEPDELLVETRWPAASPGWGYAFEELALRHGDFALAMVACALGVEHDIVVRARIAVGALGDRPRLLEGLADMLVGQRLDEAMIHQAGSDAAAGVVTHDELHASAAYQRHVVPVLVRRALRRALGGASA